MANNITFITPFYNDSKYINNLVNAMKENYKLSKNFAWLIIDDGSSKFELNNLKKKVINIPNCKIKTKKHAGVSSARNLGIKLCTTKWLMFIDSDDWYSTTFVKHFNMLSNIDKYKIIIIDLIRYRSNIVRGKYFFIYKKNYKFTFGSISNKIFKKEDIDKYFDTKVRIGEDLDFFINNTINFSINDFYPCVKNKNIYSAYHVRENSSVKQLNNGSYLDILVLSNKWKNNFDLLDKKNKHILSAINEHAYIYTYIRMHMINNKNHIKKYRSWKKENNIKQILITKRGCLLFVLSLLFKLRLEFLLLPLIKIYKKTYLNDN